MNFPTPTKIYKHHCDNLRKLEQAIELIQRDLRQNISKEKQEFEFCYTMILSHLVTAWLEIRLYKLAHEQLGFDNLETRHIETTSKAEERWVAALEISICKACQLRYTKEKTIIKKDGTSEKKLIVEIPKNLTSKIPFTIKARYLELKNIINNDLKIAIEIRNKIAHGQWVYPFSDDMLKVSSKATKSLKDENIVKIQLRMNLFKNISLLIHFLNVAPNAFDTYFDKLYRIITENQQNYKNRDYDDYRIKQIEKYKRGLLKRNENIKNM